MSCLARAHQGYIPQYYSPTRAIPPGLPPGVNGPLSSPPAQTRSPDATYQASQRPRVAYQGYPPASQPHSLTSHTSHLGPGRWCRVEFQQRDLGMRPCCQPMTGSSWFASPRIQAGRQGDCFSLSPSRLFKLERERSRIFLSLPLPPLSPDQRQRSLSAGDGAPAAQQISAEVSQGRSSNDVPQLQDTTPGDVQGGGGLHPRGPGGSRYMDGSCRMGADKIQRGDDEATQYLSR